MITSQERIKKICKEKNIAISQLEKDLKLSNGYINGKRKREFPTDRLSKIAEYLDVTTDYLVYGIDNYHARSNRAFLELQLQNFDEEWGIKTPVIDNDGQLANFIDTSKLNDKQRQAIRDVLLMNQRTLSVALPAIEAFVSSQQVLDDPQ